MKISVRQVQYNDAKIVKRLIEIEKQAFGGAGLDEWNLVPYIRHGKVAALWTDGKIIGGAQFIRDWNEVSRAYLIGIAIDSAYRGKGLGTRFLEECIKLLKADGIKCVELTVESNNTGAVNVYQNKLGFITACARKDEYGTGEDRLVMELTL
ncbi:MAG: GNAT family N-acetyltransferase [Christensenellales bacterium]